ncbi:sodium pump decarboxylase gamma subunit [Parasphaerochaeta coccoides]|uniref:Sodium pump decarboxylase gamma subunit n=1 Tax=Parasphaerochaeta coccoides (strain ATCC BAA-1237 / DSM 17374 / SPN1) TaxID=760011 RepID=F4GH74_PARC1|nr:sodium pump decarboxylase gamma subunit [Parasphaerochaeta coccoides]AEC01549.1 sodium pump decarboxylase gamma subunit [Parasphaerochaeta coccoides DSM 17374]
MNNVYVMQSLDLMLKGMVAIFIVLGAIAVATYILGKVGNKKK